MKTYDLADQFELLARILRSLPNIEAEHAFTKFFGSVNEATIENASTSPRNTNILPEGFEEKLRKMAPAEIESYLTSESELLSTNQLLELAKRLGITSSKRQGHSALVNLIIRHYEAEQMDLIIRSTRKDEG